MEEKTNRSDTRMIHIRLPEKLHKKLRVKTAELDTTIQEWVSNVIRKSLESPKKPNP
jgi:predicted HicB family RNase H-like nuclease